MKKAIVVGLILASGLMSGAAAGAHPAHLRAESSEKDSHRFNLGLSVGSGYGQVRYTCAGRDQVCKESGFIALGSVHATGFLGPVLLRARYSTDFEQRDAGRHRPHEVAYLGGLRLGGPRSPVYLAVGYGEVSDSDNDARHRIDGTAIEFLVAPLRSPIQFSVHGNTGDASYIAFSFGFVLGNP